MKELSAQILQAATTRGLTVSVAESLTGGKVAAALVDTPGASSYFRGSIVAYHPAVKHELLGVDEVLLATEGAVSAEVAAHMAQRVGEVFHTDLGVATTGVAGPEADEVGGHPPGLAFIAVSGTLIGTIVRELRLEGDRDRVRELCTKAALQGLLDAIDMAP